MSAWCGITTASLLFALVGAPGVAPAQDKWPSKSIRMIVPFTALVTRAIHYYIYPLPAIVTLLKAGTLKALGRVVIGLMKDETELFKQFNDNPDFRHWLTNTIFAATYKPPAAHAP